jgi:hypothetical protein
MHRMVHLGDEAQMKARFGPFGDSVSFSARQMHDLRQMYHSLRNRIGHTGWYSKVMGLKSKLVLVCLDTMLVSEHDGCTVCAKHN